MNLRPIETLCIDFWELLSIEEGTEIVTLFNNTPRFRYIDIRSLVKSLEPTKREHFKQEQIIGIQ